MPKQKLLTLSSGGWVILLSALLCLLAAALVLYPVYSTAFHAAIGDGKHVETYGFDLSNLSVPLTKLFASGYPKDGVRAVPEKLVETVVPPQVELIAKNESIRFLVPSDQVIGVEVAGVFRAYPVRILNLHEVVNDRLAGVPIAVTWSPLCGSVVVFDRRIDGPGAAAPEFGVSGILLDSNLIVFDRRSDTHHESLWPQLAMHAISGPALGKAFSLVPFELATWADWTAHHPQTDVFLGLRTLKEQYNDAQDPINLYLADDTLRFPVFPIWNQPGVPLKTPIIATSDDGKRWTITRASAAGAATSPATRPAYAIPSFIFAWYAQHADDSDYSAVHP